VKKVGIVILNYKNWQDTIECLEAIFQLDYDNCQVVVVDNDSRNDSLEHISQWVCKQGVNIVSLSGDEVKSGNNHIDSDFVTIQSCVNGGFAAGNNIGIKLALACGCDYVLMLNNDVIVENDFLGKLVDYIQDHGQIAVAGPKTIKEDGSINPTCARRRPGFWDQFFVSGPIARHFPNNRWVRQHYYRDEYNFDKPHEVDLISGCCMLIKREVFDKVGLLDENTFLYYEEMILHEKLREIDMLTVIIPQSVVVHKGSKSTSSEPTLYLKEVLLKSACYYYSTYRKYPKLLMFLLFKYRMFFARLVSALKT